MENSRPDFTALDQDALAAMKEQFLKHHPEFVSFTNPGTSYLAAERNYKDELLGIFSHNTLPLLLSQNDADIVALPKQIYSLLSKPLAGMNNKAQNLMRWDTWDHLSKLDGDIALQVGKLYCSLIQEDQDIITRLDAFTDAYPILIDKHVPLEKSKRSWQGILRPLASFILSFAFPQKYIFVRTQVFERASMQLLGKNICAGYTGHKSSLGHEYLQIMDISQAVREALADWEPKDFIDVQSFLWVGTRKDTGTGITQNWWPDEHEYTPGIDKQHWSELLQSPDVFDQKSLALMKRMLDMGGTATCKQISERYGESPFSYNSISVHLAKRIWKKTNCRVLSKDNQDAKWWPILYLGKRADKETPGEYIWRLRAELHTALKEADLAHIPLPFQEQPAKSNDDYKEQDFLEDVFLDAERYATLRNLLKRKKNLVLTGPPGVGKTYAAERLAWSVMGSKDEQRCKMVQFHQSYAYEDFIMGYRPEQNGFKLRHGPFYTFCKAAQADVRPHFFIIDEINRGNLSKIFGELLMLVEHDKRGQQIELLYGNESFHVPENIYIIGTMNTADRSLAMIDYALRRRFAFFELEPAFRSPGFEKTHKEQFENQAFSRLIQEILALNQEIEGDDSLGRGFCIGHSYFCNANVERLGDIVEYELVPLLDEYWFDSKEKVKRWADQLWSCIGQVLHGSL